MKRILISLGAFIWLLTMAATNALAFSVEARAGVGAVGRSNSDTQATIAAVNAFLYEGQSTEFLMGLEMMSFTQPLTIGATSNDYDAKAMLVVPAVRFKFSTSGALKPYVTLGVIVGKIAYDIPADKQAIISEDNKSFFGGRLGIGMDIGLGETYSIGVEYNATKGIPLLGLSETGSGYDLSHSDNTTYAINVGLRYHF